MKKRLICILLTLCMLVSLMPVAAFATDSGMNFTDVKKTDWFYEAVQYAMKNGLMNGTGNNQFSPNATITRGMIVTILYRMEGEPATIGEKFSDVVADQYYADAVAWANANGIVEGYSNDIFGPDDPVTREQLATILYRYMQYKGYTADASGNLALFADGASVSDYAVKSMKWAVGIGLIKGTDGNRLAPRGTATRAEAATMFMRFCMDAVPVEYAVTFKYNYEDKGVYVVGLVTEGETVGAPAAPEREGYTFDGWYTSADCSTEYDFAVVVTAPLTLYAKWTAAEVVPEPSPEPSPEPTPDVPKTYTVTFEYNLANQGTYKTVAVEDGKTVEQPGFLSYGNYYVVGWYTEAAGGQRFDFDTPITADITLYAKWREYITTPTTPEVRPEPTPDAKYTVTYVMNDGTTGVYQQQTVGTGETATEPVEPTRKLYRFTGWYAEPAATTKYDFTTPLYGDLTLYAGWGSPNSDDNGLYAASDDTETIFSISDIVVNEREVTITYNTNDVALVSVEFFEDQMKPGEWTSENLNNNLSLEPIATAAGYTESYGELATITIPIAGELPDYYLVRAKMLDGKSNSTEYVTAQYTKTYAEFNAQTVDDFDEDKVIDFCGYGTTNFGVIKDSVIVIPEMCRYIDGNDLFRVDDIDVSSSLEEVIVPDHMFTFPNKDAVILENIDGTEYKLSDLVVGDVIYVEGTTWMFKIKTIEVNENGSITFTQDKDVTLLDFYEVLKVDFDGSKTEGNDPTQRLEFIDTDAEGSASLEFNIGKEFDNGIEVSGSVEGKVTGKVKLFYDAHLFSSDYFEASFSFSNEITGTVKAKVKTGSNEGDNKEWKDVKFQIDTTKVKLPTPVTGLDIYIKPSAQIDWNLSGDVSINLTSKQTSGFKYNTDTGRTDIKKKETTVSIMAKGKAEVKLGPIIDIGVELLSGVLSGGVVAGAGAKFTAEAEIGADDLLNNTDYKHACGLCILGAAEWYASAEVKCSYKFTSGIKGDIVKAKILDFSTPIVFNGIPSKFFISVINSTDSPFGGHIKLGGGDCTNKTYRTEFKVQDSSGHNIDEICVSVVKQGQSEGKTGTTPYVVYLYDGIYIVSAKIDGTDVSKTIAVSGDRQTVVLSKDYSDTVLEGTVVDANDNTKKLSDVSVKISIDDVTITSFKTNSDGRFSVTVPSGSLTVEISKEDYLPFMSTEVVHDGDTIHSMGQIELTQGSGMGGFHGVIRDAVTNEPIADVTLNLYEGWNNQTESNTAVITLKTDDNGEFRCDTISLAGHIIGLPSGNYTLAATKEGYADISYNIIVYPGATDDNPAINETMSPEMNDGFYRIVLTWGTNPKDLDSHLVAETTSGSTIHVYYSEKDPEPHYVNLDIDDTDSEGPETITITNFDELRDIKYAVHDYTNRDKESSDSLSNSNAVVRVYKGSQLLRTFNVPTGYEGTEWDVFILNSDGNIVSINTMKYNSDVKKVLTAG